MDWESRVATAGALVWTGGRFAFAVGPDRTGDRLGVVRLGGHREPGESSAACAIREVREEASMAIRLLRPPATYLARGAVAGTGTGLEGVELVAWTGNPPPLLVTPRAQGGLSAIYLAVSDDPPVPASETSGVLLPDRAWLRRLCVRPHTLAEYLAGGGQAVLRSRPDPHLTLEPSLQVRLLDRILALHSDPVPAGA